MKTLFQVMFTPNVITHFYISLLNTTALILITTVFQLDNWAFDITGFGWDIWAFIFMNLDKFIRGELDMIPGQRMWDLWWTNWHWDMSLLRLLSFSFLIIIAPMPAFTFRSNVILAIGRAVKSYISLTKNFCVLHIQSNTDIFHLVVQ